MNPDSENFDALRRLMALKRHEQPPPGYFDRFSRDVMARIRAGEGKESLPVMERWFGQAPWLQRVWGVFEAKPVFAGAFGAAVCALLISGIAYSESMEAASPVVGPTMSDVSAPFATVMPVAMHQAADEPQSLSSTNPVGPSLDSLFNQLQLRTEQAAHPF